MYIIWMDLLRYHLHVKARRETTMLQQISKDMAWVVYVVYILAIYVYTVAYKYIYMYLLV